MAEQRYRLPEALGGGEIEAEEIWGGCAGGRPEYRLQGGVTILAPAGEPFAPVVPPLPPEPPQDSVVAVIYPNTTTLVFQRWQGSWRRPGYEETYRWADINGFEGTVVTLVPDPFAEPVELPWKGQGIEVQRTLTDSGPGNHVHVSTKGATLRLRAYQAGRCSRHGEGSVGRCCSGREREDRWLMRC
jgi:hypothetical protein